MYVERLISKRESDRTFREDGTGSDVATCGSVKYLRNDDKKINRS